MASNNQPMMIQHFADPHHHPLEQTRYRHDEAGLCNICLLKLAGSSSVSVTYGCYACNIHLHSACARYFPQIISFFAHAEHTLKFRRSPGRLCDICRGDCPPKSFVYSCTDCGFYLHPLCSMLPESVASPWDPSQQLCMFSSQWPGICSACCHPLHRWHYIGSGSLKLHVACAAIDTPAGGVGQGSSGHAAAAVVQGGHGGGAVSQRSLDAPAYNYNTGGIHGYSFGAAHPAPAGYNNPGIQGYAGQQACSYYYVPPTIQGGVVGGGYGGPPPMPIHGIHYGPATAMPGSSGGGCGQQQQSILHNPSRLMGAIAKFLLGTAISVAAGDLLNALLPSANFN